MSKPLLDHSVGELLDGVAARTPAPGGGAVAALTAAAAAGLVAMAARFSSDLTDLAAPADELRARLVELADADAAAYTAVLAAPRDRRAEALRVATEVPRTIASAAAEVALMAARLAARGNPNLTGDARVAELLAEAAKRAATVLVEINVSESEGADAVWTGRAEQQRGTSGATNSTQWLHNEVEGRHD